MIRLSNSARHLARTGVLPSALLFLLAFCVALAFRRPYMWSWDSFGYVVHVFQHERAGLGLGRWGHVLWCVPPWEAARLLLRTAPDELHHVMRLWLMLTASAGVVGMYWLGRAWGGAVVAWTGALVLLLSPGWSSYASELVPDVNMVAWMLAGLALIASGRAKERWGLQLAGFALCGWAVAVKETALLLAPAAAILWWTARPEGAARPKYRRMAWLAGVYAAAALLLPLVSFANEGAAYLAGIPNPGAEPDMTWAGIADRALYGWQSVVALCGTFPLLAAAGGVLALVIGRRWAALAFAAALALPLLAHFTFGVKDERYYIPAIPAAGLLAGVALREAGRLWRARPLPAALVIALALLCAADRFSARHLAEWRDLRWYMEQRALLAERMYRQLPEDAVLILGYNTPIQMLYHGLGLRPGWRAIPSGWDYPDDMVPPIDEFLAQGRRVFIYPKGLAEYGRERELAQVEAAFRLEPVHLEGSDYWMGLSEVLR